MDREAFLELNEDILRKDFNEVTYGDRRKILKIISDLNQQPADVSINSSGSPKLLLDESTASSSGTALGDLVDSDLV